MADTYILYNLDREGLLADGDNLKWRGINKAIKDYEFYKSNSDIFYLRNDTNNILHCDNNEEIESIIDEINVFVQDSFKKIVKIIDKQKDIYDEFTKFAGMNSRFYWFIHIMKNWKKQEKEIDRNIEKNILCWKMNLNQKQNISIN